MNDFKTVVMTRTEKGSVDGLVVNTFEKDNEYDLPEPLASIFLKELKCCKEKPQKK